MRLSNRAHDRIDLAVACGLFLVGFAALVLRMAGGI